MKLTSKQIWEMAQNVATKITVDADIMIGMTRDELTDIDSRCAGLVESPSQYDGKDYDETQTIDYFKTLVKFHMAARLAGYKVERDPENKEQMVAEIVNDILDKDNLDDTAVTNVFLDDGGNCIQITFTGAVEFPTIAAIGQAFGDPEPNVYGAGDNTIMLVISNEIRDEIKS